jgi:hypothetical protein
MIVARSTPRDPVLLNDLVEIPQTAHHHGREHTLGKLKAIIYAAARQGSIRAATYLLDRMRVWPEPENGAAAPHELKIHVIGGLAAATSGLPPHASSSHLPRTRRDEI